MLDSNFHSTAVVLFFFFWLVFLGEGVMTLPELRRVTQNKTFLKLKFKPFKILSEIRVLTEQKLRRVHA